MKSKKPQYKQPNNPREALKSLNYTLGKLWNRKEDEPVNYVQWAKKYVKYLEGFVALVEKTTVPEPVKEEVSTTDTVTTTDTDKVTDV